MSAVAETTAGGELSNIVERLVEAFVREQGPASTTTVLDSRDWALVPMLRQDGAGGALVGRF